MAVSLRVGCTETPVGRGVLEGAFALLDVLQQVGEAGLTRLAADSGLPKATAYRLLEQLASLGAVEKADGQYRLGPHIFRLGQAWRPDPALRGAVRGPMRRLARATGATVGVAALSRGQLMVVGGIPGELAELVPISPGMIWPWSTGRSTAVGKVLHACAPEVASLAPLPATLLREAAEIRDAGMAFDREEVLPGVYCVAAPLYGPNGAVVASMCLVASSSRSLPRLSSVLVRACATVSAALR